MKKAIWLGIGGFAIVVAIALYRARNHAPQEIVAAGPNPFVSGVVIEQIGEDAAPFGDTIEIPASKGVYVVVRLKRFPDPPATFGEREVSPPQLWPATLAVFRNGEPDGPGACEIHCAAPGPGIPGVDGPPHAISRTAPPPYPPPMGTNRGWSRTAGFAGPPQLPKTSPDENLYWTFLVPPDIDEPAGEYVYEVRLYPTTRWLSRIRLDVGEPVVLKRGLLVAADPSNRAVGKP